MFDDDDRRLIQASAARRPTVNPPAVLAGPVGLALDPGG
jgi:hypothetical protein